MQISQRQAELFGALGDVHRLLLLYALVDQPRSVGDLVGRLGLPQPTVSHHLRILREVGMVDAERRGRSMYYYATEPRIFQAMDLLRSICTEQMQKQGDAAHNAAPRPII